MAANPPRQLQLTHRKAREKMAVKEPLDREGLDLAKPLVSKIWNEKKEIKIQKPCSTQKKKILLLLKDTKFI